ncbi:hypothetical protein [Chelatococcus reniformis]|uniref:hypothetical protein n=1 Tax=Chelatococcus reniformis TaxID=1494448 RepID=UPI001667CA48|nr:hypothetical protein [Chelatococcus reniformis]
MVDPTDVAPPRASPARRSAGEWLRRGALHWRAFLLCLLLPILAALLLASLLPTTYEAEARLLVRIDGEYAAGTGRHGTVGDPGRIARTEAAVLTGAPARRAVLQAIGPLRIYPDLAGEPAEAALDEATRRLGGQLRAESEPDSFVVRIAFRHHDRAAATAVVDGLVQASIEPRHRLPLPDQGQQQAAARDKAELDAAERDIAALRQGSDPAELEARHAVLVERRQGQDEVLRRLEARRAGLDGAAAASRAAAPPPAPVAPASDAGRANAWEAEQLRQRLAEAQADRARLISIFGPQSTAILDRQIAALRKQLAVEPAPANAPERRPQPPPSDPLAAERGRLDRDIAAAAQQLRDTGAQLAAVDERLGARSTEMSLLLRRRDAAAARYETDPRPDSGAGAGRSAGVTVIEPALARGRDLRAEVLAAGLALGLLLAPVAALAMAATRPVLLTPADAARLGIPCLGTTAAPGRGGHPDGTPEARAAHHLPRLNDILPIAQALRTARAGGTTAPHTVLFVSLPPETASGHMLVRDTAMALAEEAGKPVLLVDAASQVHNAHFSAHKLIAEPVAEAFMGSAAPPEPVEARQPPQASATGTRAVVLRTRRVAGAPLFIARAEDALPALAALRGGRQGGGDDELSRRFARIVIDGSAALNDFRVLRETASVDATVLMLTAAITTEIDARRLVERIDDLGGRTLGTVLLDGRRRRGTW